MNGVESRFFEDFDVGARYPTRSRTITDADLEPPHHVLMGIERPAKDGKRGNQHGTDVFRNDKTALLRRRA